MPAAGLFKHLLWLVPVTAILFYYITSQQKVSDDKIDAEFSKFDEKFDRMQESMSTGDMKKEWHEEKLKAHDKRVAAEERSMKSVEKDDAQFAEMEKDLQNTNFENNK